MTGTRLSAKYEPARPTMAPRKKMAVERSHSAKRPEMTPPVSARVGGSQQ